MKVAASPMSKVGTVPGVTWYSLQKGDAAWEKQVPGPIADLIKSKKLFGCP